MTEPFRTTRFERETVPWLNGQGTTQVVLASDLWRVSIAEEPRESTFSVIEGYDRLFTPIGSEPVELSGPTPAAGAAGEPGWASHVVRPLETFRFEGEWAPRCRVAVGTRALNVMGRRGKVDMTVRVTGPDLSPTPDDEPDTLRIHLEIATETAVVVPPGSAHVPRLSGIVAVVTIASPTTGRARGQVFRDRA